MPPYISRKRARSPTPPPPQPSKKRATPRQLKKTVFDDADALQNKTITAEHAKKFFEVNDASIESDLGDDNDSDDSDELEFEDVPTASKHKSHVTGTVVQDEEDSDDDEMEWEDATGDASSIAHPPRQEIGDLSISIKDDGSYIEPLVSAATGRKGPSKRERQARVQTHCLHVQTLMWHNTVRNSWLNDVVVQNTLVDGLPEGVKRAVRQWRERMGIPSKAELDERNSKAAQKNQRGKRGGRKVKEKEVGRDWSYRADHTEHGVPDLSHGDPLLRLLKILAAYWRKRFTITAPGLRKQGYMSLRQLREEIKDWDKNRLDFKQHGERIENREQFRKLAKTYEGSRDVGAQLFVALLRGIGIETRMVSNLQPAGIGWSKGEEAMPKTQKKDIKLGQPEVVEDDVEDLQMSNPKHSPVSLRTNNTPVRRLTRGSKAAEPISLDTDSESPLSSAPSDLENGHERTINGEDDDVSVVDLDPPIPKKPNKKYDRDMAFPVYWAEVMSPVSNKYIPVDPIVLSTIASNDELLQTFEPRGKKADVSKQVICYAIAHNADGSAKDVTVRYLKKHQLPGKTKGVRIGIERIPVYNRRGKVKKYEDYDWFRTVMSIYDRPEAKRTLADEYEDQTDLKPFKPGKEEKIVEKESLQWYKQSADYVLEQHLRREEAIRPGAEPVKTFVAGKGDKLKDHPVFLRDDVLACKTVESWHKEGRELKVGEQPMKMVPIRAVTIVRKREIEEAERETGEKLKQGLYFIGQTDWIIPPPILDGRIPRNAFGNIDVYVPTMVPKGAVHLPLKGSAKLCKKLSIDFAEACTGFEFGKQRAVPVLTGVVVAKENERLVRDAWRTDQAEMKRKEDTKRTDAALKWWRKMLMGLRILERMEREYEDREGEDERNPFVRHAETEHKLDVDAGGGFLKLDEDRSPNVGGGFLNDEEMEQDPERLTKGDSLSTRECPEQELDEGGGFLVEDHAEEPAQMASHNLAHVTPVSIDTNVVASSILDGVERTDKFSEDSEDQVSPPLGQTVRSVQARSRKSQVKQSGKASSRATELRTSPIVIPSPRQARARPRENSRYSDCKTQSVRSRYFVHEDDDNDDLEELSSTDNTNEGQDEICDDSSSEDEVIVPRATTRRTRQMRNN
ncbi:Rad4-domain-containing protein [Polychaeton citri CBS 116435]|uniref:Rad4-domain-containing protein n=1 Tax=Polychaeton citri CBS 116435 TaxID=1314669 RepID=A0A9P4UQ63_9PEZI|nr:Rad4-domain-containing protein [Polychaeton citri CBS 116435]